MAKDLIPVEERQPDTQEWAPRPPRKADDNDQRDSDSEPEQEYTPQDGDSVDLETDR